MRPSAHAATTIISHGHRIAPSSTTDQYPPFSFSSSPSPSLDQSLVDTPDDPPPPCRDSVHHQVPASSDSTRVKLLCSYGGRIISRPHNNQLGYTGGESRIIVVPRSISFSDFVSKLSRVAFNDDHCHISVKYQLPSEDLDALISITCDEDLENMMEEFDKMQVNNQINRPSSAGMNRSSPSSNSSSLVSSSSNSSSPVSPSRIRLFLFPAKNSGRSQSDSIPDAKIGRNHQQPRDALNQGLSPAAAEIAPAISAKQSHFAIPDYGNADKESDGNLHLLRETSADAFEVWASARSYGNATKDDRKSFKYGLQMEKMNGNKVFSPQENVINQVAGTSLGSHGGVNIEVESDIQDLNEDNKGMSRFEKEKLNLQKISRDSHSTNVNKLVEFDNKTMNGSEMEGPGFTGDPIFDEEMLSLRNDLGILDHLESKVTLDKTSTISSRQFQISSAMTISDQSHQVPAVQPKDRSNSTYSTSKVKISAENDAIPSNAVQDAATKPWTQVPDPPQSRGKGVASAGSGRLPPNTAPTIYSLNHGFSTISSRNAAMMDPLSAQKVLPAGVQPLQDSEKKKLQPQVPVINQVLHKDVTPPPWNTGRKLPSTTPLTHEICFGLDAMSRSSAMEHQHIPVQNNVSPEGPIIDLHQPQVQYEPSLRLDAPAKMMKKSNTTPPVYNMPAQGSVTDQDQRPPFTLFSNLYTNMLDGSGNVVEPPYPNASNVRSDTHEDVTLLQQPAKIKPFMEDFRPYKLDEHNHNNIAVELANSMLPSASSSHRSRPYIL